MRLALDLYTDLEGSRNRLNSKRLQERLNFGFPVHSTNVKTYRTSWQARLATRTPSYLSRAPNGFSTSLIRTNPTTDFEYEIEIVATADYQPFERQTWEYPGCPEGFENIEAYYFRPGKGWIQIDLTDDEADKIAEQMLCSRHDAIAEARFESRRDRYYY